MICFRRTIIFISENISRHYDAKNFRRTTQEGDARPFLTPRAPVTYSSIVYLCVHIKETTFPYRIFVNAFDSLKT
jgi:hypothetical protein